MTRSELGEALAARVGLSKARGEAVVDTVFDVMRDALLAGERIEVRGFGAFQVRQYASYPGRNPKTGAPVTIEAKRLPFFKVARELREIVNEGAERPLDER